MTNTPFTPQAAIDDCNRVIGYWKGVKDATRSEARKACADLHIKLIEETRAAYEAQLKSE